MVCLYDMDREVEDDFYSNENYLAELKTVQRPSHIDPESWDLIQQIQQEEETKRRASMLNKRKSHELAKILEEEELELDGISASSEDPTASLELAKLLHDEEHNARVRQLEDTEESQKLALAMVLQDQEEAVRIAQQQNLEALEALHKEQDNLSTSVIRIIRTRSKEEELALLKPCQQKAFQYVQKKAKRLHESAMPELVLRCQNLGFQPQDLTRCLEHIEQDAPIVMHVSEEALGYLVQDTHYRNIFETGMGSSQRLLARRKWERGLFGGAYDDSEPFLRPKYGCLNIFGAIRGVEPARGYGKAYIVLAHHVRYRSTFLNQDSSINCTITPATNEYYGHILGRYTDEELCAVLNVSRFGSPRCVCEHYKEVQIHGPVCLATDIQALSMPGRECDASIELRAIVDDFQKQTGCNVLWQGDLLLP